MPYNRLPDLSPEHLSRRNLLDAICCRNSGQLTVAVILAVITPYLLRSGLDGFTDLTDHAKEAITGQLALDLHVFGPAWPLLGVVLTHGSFRLLSGYPGENKFSSAVPATLFGFGSALLFLVMTRFDYSRFLLISSFFATLFWYSAVNLLQGRISRKRLLLTPIGTARDLARIKSVEWLKLTQPQDMALVIKSDGVVIDLETDLPKDWSDFLIRCASEGVPVFDSTRTRELLTGQVELVHAGDIGIDALLPKRPYLAMKSLIDVTMALATLPVTLPLIAIAAAAIKLDSPGPAFFVQKRVGFRGRLFDCYKLRTMQDRADQVGLAFTSNGDPRITRLGKALRKYRIDELPQVLNIIKGDMSWIGPRPEAVVLSEEYQRHIPFYAFRHAVKPGISGWAAVMQGNVAEVEAATVKLQHDFFYIKNLSPWLDAYIASRTVWILLSGHGSK